MPNDISLAGTWAYQSYLNQADQPVFGTGLFSFRMTQPAAVTGTLDMGDDLVLDLKGTITQAKAGAPLTAEIIGVGRPGSKTDGWQYDYYAYLAFRWPEGVDQVQSLVGSVLRARPHNGQPAGVTASFIAVRQSW
jgi:hypothetical protein